MSFASSLAYPASAGFRGARALIRGGSLQSMARAVGVVVGAGVLAASYQIASEEGRAFIQSFRVGASERRHRNDAINVALLNSGLPIDTLDRLRRSRDTFRTAMRMTVDAEIPEGQRQIISATLTGLYKPVV